MSPEDNVPYVDHTASGEPARFAKLSLEDVYIGILVERRKAKKLAQIENLKLMGIAPEEWLGELEKVDDQPATLQEFIDLTNDGLGQIKVLEYCWRKQNPEDVAAGKRIVLTARELIELLPKVCAGLPIRYGESSGETGDATEEPSAATAYGQPGAPEENPPELAYAPKT